MNYYLKDFALDSIEEALKICNIELGNHYLTTTYISQLLKNENAFLKCVINDQSEIIGFGICTILSSEEFKNSLHSSQFRELPENIKNASRLGITNTIAIKEEYKGKGIGTLIFNQFLAFFELKKIDIITAFAWKSKDGFNMEGIFKKHNFPILKTIQNYWKEDSIENKYDCPSCGNPCICSAVIYGKFK
jgi:ribosomal protein S18 acetylase RimI-like enzyme